MITLGSPILGDARATRAWRVYERASGLSADDAAGWVFAGHQLTVPMTSIWSRSDGIVAWRASYQEPGPRSENIAVHASHLGIGVNASALYAVADRLAQPEDQWKPFAPPLALRGLYPRTDRR